MYSDAKDELQRVRTQLVKSTPSPTPSLAAQRVLKQVEMVSSRHLLSFFLTAVISVNMVAKMV